MEYLQQFYEKIFGSDGAPQSSTNEPCKVVAFGNVLLDRTARLEDTTLLERFNIKIGTKGELDNATLNTLTTEACESLKCIVNPGGSALNTVRILKHLGTDAAFFGAVGDDEHAEELKRILQERGIQARLQTICDMPTGQCICLLHGGTAALYANIGASSKFTIDFLKRATHNESQAFLRPIERKQIIYIEGFFVPQREEVCDYIVKNFIHERRRLALNLSAAYIVREQHQQIFKLAQSAYFIFGNNNEFTTFASSCGCENVEELAKILLKDGQTKIMIIKKGAKGVQLITNYVEELAPAGDTTFQSFNVQRVEQVVDTTGAGDAFVAGFLHAWLEKRALSECVRIASDVAGNVVTQIGCNLTTEA